MRGNKEAVPVWGWRPGSCLEGDYCVSMAKDWRFWTLTPVGDGSSRQHIAQQASPGATHSSLLIFLYPGFQPTGQRHPHPGWIFLPSLRWSAYPGLWKQVRFSNDQGILQPTQSQPSTNSMKLCKISDQDFSKPSTLSKEGKFQKPSQPREAWGNTRAKCNEFTGWDPGTETEHYKLKYQYQLVNYHPDVIH